MRRLSVGKYYLRKVFELKKFYSDKMYDLKKGEPLLLQLLKTEEPGRFIGRVQGIIFFDSWLKEVREEAKLHYNRDWNYAIKFDKSVKFVPSECFNLKDVLERGKGQAV